MQEGRFDTGSSEIGGIMNIMLASLMAIILRIATGFLLGLVMAFPLMWIWNWLVSEKLTILLFNSNEIGVMQSFFILFLTSLLFKNNK